MFYVLRVAVTLLAAAVVVAAWQVAQLVIPDEIGVPLVLLVLGGLTGTLGYLVKQASDNRSDNRVTIAKLEDIQRRLDNVEHHR